MRIWWYILAVILGFLAAMVATLWPVSPLWMVQPAVSGAVIGFNPDSKSLYTAHVPQDGNAPFVCRWDLETGRELQRIVLDEVKSEKINGSIRLAIRISRDCKTLFAAAWGTNYDDPYFLHDAQTGKRYAGPIFKVAFFGAESEDGRWFSVRQGVSSQGKFEGIDLLSTKTGQRIHELRDKEGMKPSSVQFSPDGETALVAWNSTDKETGRKKTIISILALPSTKEIKHLELPANRTWSGVNRWDGRYLWCEHHLEHPDYPGQTTLYHLRRTVRFDTASESLSYGEEEPLLSGEFRSTEGQTWWDEGDTWVAYQSFVKPGQIFGTRFQQWQNWVYDKLKWKRPDYDLLVFVQVVNRPAGTLRYQLPFAVGYPAYFSKNGRRHACRTKDGGIAVYDLDPFPRWPWSLAAGCCTAALILLLGYWRSRRIAASRRIGNSNLSSPGNGV